MLSAVSCVMRSTACNAKQSCVVTDCMQVLGNTGHQCSCDIWSAGVIMYILLAGYTPFNGPNERAILRQIKRGQYTFAGMIPYC